ncbi:MAG: SBBP repeat-containing protein [Chitinophagales bacterium]
MKHLSLVSLLCFTVIYGFSQTELSTPLIAKTGAFAENLGQVVDQEGKPVSGVLAKGGVPGLDIYLTESGVTYVLLQYEEDLSAEEHPVYVTANKKFKVHYSRVDVELKGAALSKGQLEFSKAESYQTGYYYGSGQYPAVAMYKEVKVKNVYPGIDWVWKINDNGKAEYDFVVHPGANSNSIQMQYRYADLKAKDNELFISSRNGTIREGDLQASADHKKVSATYNLQPEQKQVSFTIGNYDQSKDLIIDPPLSLLWSAQFGGTFADGLRGVATDTLGNAYLVGYSTSVNFPFLNPGSNGYCDSTFNGNTDVIILKVSPTQTLLWATYMGGAGNDFANSVFVTKNGRIFIAGGAQAGFPNAYSFGSYLGNPAVGQDVFISLFSPGLSLQWSTFYGGSGTDEALKIFYDEVQGRLWLTGYTNSGTSFPIKNQGTFTKLPKNGYDNPFLLEFLTNGANSLIWATGFPDTANAYGTSLAGSGTHFAITGFSSSPKLNYFGGNPAYLNNNGGVDGFVLHFNVSGQPQFERFFGGSGNDYITDITIAPNNSYFITGRTNSNNFPLQHLGNAQYYQPTLAGSYDAFISKFESDTVVKWSTYYGGTDMDAGTGIATDNNGSALMTGFTFSNNFPVDSPSNGGYYQGVNKGASDGFIATFTEHGLRTYSTYKGDSCYEYPADIAASPAGNFYVCGEGFFACNKSIPDSVSQFSSSNGFCWNFDGAPVNCLPVSASGILNPCPATNNGEAVVHYSGGIPPYSITWGNAETTDTAFSLYPGINYVLVSDSVGCSGEANVAMNPLSFHYSSVAGDCYNNGSAAVVNPNGNAPYSYNWSNGLPNQSQIVAAPGAYTVTLTDSRNCTASGFAYINSNNVVDTVINVLRDPGCGLNNGILTALNNGLPVIVEWYDSNNNLIAIDDTLRNLGPGTYHINADKCISSQIITVSVELTDPGIIENLSADIPAVVAGCQNSVPLTAYLNSSNYFPCYFEWSTGQIDIAYDFQDALYISSLGNYSVTITDGVGCTATATVEITTQDYIDTAYTYVTQPTCYNTHDGIINVQAFDLSESGDLQYYWSGPGVYGETTADIGNLGPGTYTLIVSSLYSGCEHQYEFQIAPPGSSDISIVSAPVGCGPNSGYAEVTNWGAGGWVPIAWYDGANNYLSDSIAITNLFPDTYYVVVDNVYTTCVVIGQEPDEVHVDIDSVGYICTQGLNLHAEVYNGTAPYDYTWGQFYWNNAADLTANFSGPYTVTVTDYLGCIVSASANYGYHQPFTLSYTTQARCNSDSTDITVTPHGGYPPYSGAVGTHTYGAGSADVIIYDSQGCMLHYVISVSHHNYLHVTYTYSPPACNTAGSITISATGGTAPYSGTGTFALNTGFSAYPVSDAAGCRDTVKLNMPLGAITLNYTVDEHWCTDHKATVTLTPSGGAAPYSGDTGQIQLPAGNYNFLVTDNNGCAGSATLTLSEPPALNANYTASNILCYGGNSTIAITATGGTTPYGGGIGTHIAPAGNYTYVVTDNAGCTDTLAVSVTQPAQLDLTATATDAGCYGTQGTVSLNTSGGTSPYTYPNGQGGALYAGAYTFTVSDNNGCADTVHATINQPNELQAAYTATPILCNGLTTTIAITASGGTTPYGGAIGTHIAPAGSYTYVVTDDAGCTDTLAVSVTQPAQLDLTATVTDANCYGTQGAVSLNISGGTSPYTYPNGQGGALYAGAYTFTVSDNNGCVDTVHATVNQPTELQAAYTATSILCNGSTSTVAITATGGTSPYSGDIGNHLEFAGNYTYIVTDDVGCSDTLQANLIQPAALNINASVVNAVCYGAQGEVTVSATGGTGSYTYPNGQGGLVYAGAYNYIVSDANGCGDSIYVVVTQPTELVANYTANSILCNGGTTTITVAATGGTAGYSGDAGTHVVLAGSYTYIVNDQAGCSDTVTAVITEPSPLGFSAQAQGPFNCNAVSVPVTVTAFGGSAPYSNSGNFTISTDSIYNWQVTDNNGCEADSNFSVVLPSLNVSIQGAPDTVCRNSDVHLNASGNYISVWNGNVTDSVFNLSNLQNNTVVTLTAYAANSVCRVTDTVSITVVTCVGVPELVEENTIKVYPNPANEVVHLVSESALNAPAIISVFAADGKLVAEQYMNTGDKASDIACDKLAAGSYIIDFATQGKHTHYRVIVQR